MPVKDLEVAEWISPPTEVAERFGPDISVAVINNHPGLDDPRAMLTDAIVRLESTLYKVKSVESFCIALPYPDHLAIAVAVLPYVP